MPLFLILRPSLETHLTKAHKQGLFASEFYCIQLNFGSAGAQVPGVGLKELLANAPDSALDKLGCQALSRPMTRSA